MITKIKKTVTWMLCAALFTINYSLFTSCEDLLETDSDRQIFDPALDQKTDSMFYTLGIMKGVQMVADQYVMTGEMRGDLVQTNQYTETDLRSLADFSADITNKYDSAYAYYRIINNCNYYIAHRDTTLRTGSQRIAIPEYAEALAVRAWTYLQLCKTYGVVPFYTDPLTSIGDANKQFVKKDLQGICDALIPELLQFSGLTVDGGTPVPDYSTISAGVLNSSESGTATEKEIQSKNIMIPVDVILGDLYLETHQYENAAKHYFQYIVDNKMNASIIMASPSNEQLTLFKEIMPEDFVSTSTSPSWSSIFSGSRDATDIITYIPLATNRMRGTVTELPRYFGYDFYSTTGGNANSSDRFLKTRQIDASQAYLSLTAKQDYYYQPAGSDEGSVDVYSIGIGDCRRYATMRQVTPSSRADSAYHVIVKFNSANVPIYRRSTIYLRLAEAINRMGYPDAAFAILKDGINYDGDAEHPNRLVEHGDSTDLGSGRYIKQTTAVMLSTTLPFLTEENRNLFQRGYGIHSRGSNNTRGRSGYQYNAIVGQKLDELAATFNLDMESLTLQDTINAIEDILCDEMALELAFEGNRFGDLTRLARHKNNAGLYGANFGGEWIARKLEYKNPVKSLRDEKNWYLPFRAEE